MSVTPRTARARLITLEIPTDWTLKRDGYGQGFDIVSTPAPHCYSVTIDWARRTYRCGLSCTGQKLATKPYKGRRWRQNLLDDAVAWLTGLLLLP